MGIKATPLMPSGAYQNTLVLTVTPGYIAAPSITNVYLTNTTTDAWGPTSGGVTIDIIGTSFDTAYQVFIDLNGNGVQDTGEQCTSPNIVSSTKITCVTPANSMDDKVDIVVNTWGGSVTKVDGYEYTDEIWGFTVDTSIRSDVIFRAAASVPLRVDFGNGVWVDFATGATISGVAVPTAGVAPLSRIRVRPQDPRSYDWFPIGTSTYYSSNSVLIPTDHLKTLDYPVTTRSISNSGGAITRHLAYAFYGATNLTTSVSFKNSRGITINTLGDNFLYGTHEGNSSIVTPIDLAPLASWSVSGSIGNNFLSSVHRGDTAITAAINLTPLAGWSVTSVGSNFLAQAHTSSSLITSPINLGPMTNWNVSGVLGDGFLSGAHYLNGGLSYPIDLAPLASWRISSIGDSFLSTTHLANTVLRHPMDLTPLTSWVVTSIGDSFLRTTHSNNSALLASLDLSPIHGWSVTSIGSDFLQGTHAGCTGIISPINLGPMTNWRVSGSIGDRFLYDTHYYNSSLTAPIDLSPLARWDINGSLGADFLKSTHIYCGNLSTTINLTPLASWNVTSIGDGFLSETHGNSTGLTDISAFRLPNWAKDKIVYSSNALYRTFYVWASHSTTGGEPTFMDGTVISSVGSPVATPTNRETYTNRSSINPSVTGWK